MTAMLVQSAAVHRPGTAPNARQLTFLDCNLKGFGSPPGARICEADKSHQAFNVRMPASGHAAADGQICEMHGQSS